MQLTVLSLLLRSLAEIIVETDSRVTQEKQVEHGVILEQVHKGPTQHPTTDRQQAETTRNRQHIP